MRIDDIIHIWAKSQVIILGGNFRWSLANWPISKNGGDNSERTWPITGLK
jgi:hypothetical protein